MRLLFSVLEKVSLFQVGMSLLFGTSPANLRRDAILIGKRGEPIGNFAVGCFAIRSPVARRMWVVLQAANFR